ncbi:MAG: NAD-dependent dehydratase [Planctomyces sp.]|nr:NAD-dependent dehydratase [Planctomyces sp.]
MTAPSVDAHKSTSLKHKLWSRFFNSSSGKQVALRVAVDFCLANASLACAALFSLAATGKVTLGSPIGYIIARINAELLASAGWFSGSAIAMFALCGLYKPVPSSHVWKRLTSVASACLVGFVFSAIVGSMVLESTAKVVGAIGLAWAFLYTFVTASRFSRMYVAQRYRVELRRSHVKEKVEDVLVVGGAGYIGSIATRQLLDAGYRVRVLDLQLFGINALSELLDHPRLEVMEGDFRNVEDVVRGLKGMDAVVHLAAIVGDPACSIDSETTIAVNYAAAKMIAQLARANGISRFIFASTCSVYGASDDIRDEQSDLNPVSLYATTKIDAEKVLLETADSVFQPTILRFATAYGWSHRPRFDLVANLLPAQAVTQKKFRVFNGEQWRPFVHTVDLARSIVMSLQAPLSKVGGEIFNVGDESQNYTLTQLGQIVKQMAPDAEFEEIRNDEDPRNYRVNFDKIKSRLGFRASVKLEDGISEIVNAVRSGQVSDWSDPIYSNRQHLQDHGLTILKFERKASENEMPMTQKFLQRVA